MATTCSPLKPGTLNCETNLALLQGILNIVTDAAIIVLPLPMVYNLNIPVREKVALAAVLSAGIG